MIAPLFNGRRAAFPLGAVATAVLLAGCGGSSSSGSSEPALRAQAVDGYLVGSSVYCDDVGNGGTGLAGRFTCPAGTDVFRIVGGSDVGFEEEAEAADGTLFVGELKAPSSLDWVTPLSTIAFEIASEDGDFDRSLFDGAVDTLAAALGQSNLDLNADATTTQQLRVLNAQLNELISAFADTGEDYATVGRNFGALIRESARGQGSVGFDLEEVATVATALNARLAANAPGLRKDNESLGEAISRVQEVNRAVGGGGARPPAAASAPPVVRIDRDEAVVEFSAGGAVTPITLESFESDALVVDAAGEGAYATVVDAYSDYLAIGRSAFDVRRALNDRKVSLGFELDAVEDDDRRVIAVTTSEARLTARPASEEMTLTLPAGSELNVRSVSAVGTTTDTAILLNDDYVFSSANGGIELSFWRIDERLREEGFGDIVATSGNYRLTAVIGGVRVGEVDDGVPVPASQYTVDTDGEVVTGTGFQGYVTLDRFVQ